MSGQPKEVSANQSHNMCLDRKYYSSQTPKLLTTHCVVFIIGKTRRKAATLTKSVHRDPVVAITLGEVDLY